MKPLSSLKGLWFGAKERQVRDPRLHRISLPPDLKRA
jgi:hypothetical protein